MEGIKLFNRWDTSEVKVSDPGLRPYMNVNPIVVPRSGGRFTQYYIKKNKMHIVERFMNRMMVPGHKGKKHKIFSRNCPASTHILYNKIIKAFEIIEKQTKKNPVQVLVQALENSALLEEIASYRMGGVIARQAVIVSPTRRLDLALRYMTQGIYASNFRNKKPLEKTIAEELIAAANNDPKSHAVRERQRLEREAEGAR